MSQRRLRFGLLLLLLTSATALVKADNDIPAGIDANRLTPVVRAVQRARSSTVNIHTEKRARPTDTLFGVNRDRKVNGMGTGIVIDERGYILTNHHVVLDVDSLRVTLYDGSSYTARVISYDAKHDLAVIKIDPTRKLRTMPMGTSSDLLLGEDVIAIGNAYGYEHTCTKGIISALSRDVEVNEEQSYENLIQIDAAINPGNSGGPLINCNGEVIGVNVAIRAGAQKIGFAIPIDDARRIAAQLINIERLENCQHGMRVVDHKKGRDWKLIVQGLMPNSPAALAGLKPGDVVRRVGDVDIVDGVDLERALLEQVDGRPVSIEVERNSARQTLNMVLAKLSPQRQTPGRQSIKTAMPVHRTEPTKDLAWSHIGVRLAKLEPSQRSLVAPRYQGGMLVTQVKPGSPAQANGISKGDILVGLHHWETVSVKNVSYVMENPKLWGPGPLKFYILRDGETLYGHFDLSDMR